MNPNSFFKYLVGWAKRSPATVLLHLALVVILVGALTTHFFGRHGRISLQADSAVSLVADPEGNYNLPFSLTLREVGVDYYPASTAPRDYSCELTVAPSQGAPYQARIAMNKVLKVDGRRFTLVSIGPDSATLTVNHDPAGIFITYLGYALLLVAMIAFFMQRRTGFRSLLSAMAKSRGVAACMLLLATFGVNAQEAVRSLIPDNVARTFGKIYVYWDDRPAPVQTMSRALLAQVYGRDSYCGMSADQVVLGWLVNYNQWKNEPIIRVKSQRVRQALGISGKYARLTDFFGPSGYKLQPLLDGHSGEADIMTVDRSVQLLSSLAVGKLMRIFPYMSANGRMEWLSWTDYKPSQMPLEQWDMVSNSMSEVVRNIILNNPDGARSALLKIRRYQLATTSEAGAPLSESRFRAEIWYNRIASPLWAAICLIILPLAAGACLLTHRFVRLARYGILVATAAASAWLSALIVLRWIIADHWPLSNGPESMEVMALLALLIGIICFRRCFIVSLMAPAVAGMSLAVAAMSGNASVISPMMPVLNNPLLSVHVFVIMLAYALLTIIMLLSAVSLCGGRRLGQERRKYLWQLTLCMLYPAVFLLCAGIFIGAVWANQSWGRYWGWDPKETWALITMLVYSVPLHWPRLRLFRRPVPTAVYLVAAFICVLITYFGVNFLLGGLHSYM